MKRFCAFTLAAFAAFLLGQDFKVGIIPPLPHVVEAAQPSPETWSPDPPASQSEVPLLEFPVIPGGVHDSQVLYAALKEYPSLYGNFDYVSARLIQLDHALAARTSYRRDGKILWTKNAVIIPAGRWVWMDAAGHVVVAQCGNALDLSAAPLPPDDSTATPEASLEPPGVVLSLPPDVPATLPMPYVMDAVFPPTQSIPTVSDAVCATCQVFPGTFVGSRTPPTPTPEPSIWALAIFGLLILVTAQKFRAWRYRRTIARRLRAHIDHQPWTSRRAA